jgi:hypothetical protein
LLALTALPIECYILPSRREREVPVADESKSPNQADNIKGVQIGGESFVDRVLPHMKKILVAIGVGVVILVVVFTARWIGERGQAKETAKLASLVQVASRSVRGAGEEAKPGEITYASGKDRAAAVLAELNKQSTDMVSDTYRGSLAMQAEQYDLAIPSFRKASGTAGLDGVLAREGLTLALEAKATAEKDAAVKQKGLEDALAAARAIQTDANGPRRVYGLYHEARLLVLLGKNAEAKTLFEKVKTMAEGTELNGLAEARLAALEAAS